MREKLDSETSSEAFFSPESSFYNDKDIDLSTPLKRVSNNVSRASTDTTMRANRFDNRDVEDTSNFKEKHNWSKANYGNSYKRGRDLFSARNQDVNYGLSPSSERFSDFDPDKAGENVAKGNYSYYGLGNDSTDFINAREPVYYKPTSSSDNITGGIKSFLPKGITLEDDTTPDNLRRSRRFPLVNIQDVDKEHNTSKHGEEDIEEEEYMPTGEWTSPVVKEALRRQVNKEKECKKFILNLILFFVFRYILRLIKDAKDAIYESQQLPFQKNYENYLPLYQNDRDGGSLFSYSGIIQKSVFLILFLNAATSLYKLLRKQDQCLDLPLTERQRGLIGLSVGSSEQGVPGNVESKDTELILKKRMFLLLHKDDREWLTMPKYTKSNAYTSTYSRPKAAVDSNVVPAVRQLPHQPPVLENTLKPIIPSSHLNQLSRKDFKAMKTRFSETYNIDFNYNDGDDVGFLPASSSLVNSSVESRPSVSRNRYNFILNPASEPVF